MEAVKQGSATVGLKNKTHAILVALKVKVEDRMSIVSHRDMQEAVALDVHKYLSIRNLMC